MNRCKISDKTWNQHFYQIAERFADKTAIVEAGRSITYQELNQKANRLASILRAEGIVRNQRVAIMMNNSIAAVVSIMAVLKSGGAYVPINPKDALQRKKRIVADSESEILITGIENDCADLAMRRVIIYEEINRNVSSENLSDLNSVGDYAYLLYTSGSTGNPKGAIITHNNVCTQMDGVTKQYGFTSGDVWTQFHTICFDFSVLEIFGCLYSGATLLIIPENVKYNTNLFIDFIKRHHVTVLGLVPSVLYRIAMETVAIDGLSIHTLILGGEKLSFSKLKSWFAKLPGIQIINGYGLTETTIFNMGKTITKDDVESDISNIGQAFYPNQVCIVEGGSILGAGEAGEICLGGPAVSIGYWNHPRLNEEKYVVIKERKNERFFRTGDLGRLLSNGDIEFIGRADNQVKIRGFRVEIEEIENKLRLCELVKDVAVKISSDASQVLCFVVLKEGDVKALHAYAVKNLPPYMVPSRWILLDELPLTERGKVDKARLTVEEREGFSEEYVPCTTATQLAILRIWQADFPHLKIGAKDSYYELGGSSLSVIHMLDQVGKQYQTELSLMGFMQEPTIYALSRMAERAEASIHKEGKNIRFGKYQDIYPMTDLQQAFFIGRQTDVELGNCASHSYAEIVCHHYDANRFRQALDTLVNRHDLLRCRFDVFGNHHIESSITYEIPVHDYSLEDDAAREQKIQKVRKRMENMIVDYTKAPLARVEISLIGHGNALIHLYLDALIADGWSHELLLYEADVLYCGQQQALPPLEFHYGDFVEYNERLKETKKYRKAREFWLGKIATLPENPLLPMSKKHFFADEIESEQERKVIRWDVWKKIETAANAMGLSTFIISLAAFCKVIARYSKNQRFVINLPVSNRPQIHDDINQIVGVCSNFFLFDYENRTNETLLDTAKRVQKQMWELKENDSFNGNEIIREIYKESGRVGSFVATIVFTSLLDIPLPQKKNLERVYLETHTSQIWMDTVMISDAEGISINCDFVKGLLERSFVNRMMDDCIMLLERLAADRYAWEHITALALSEQEKTVRQKNNLTERELPRDSIMDYFLKAVKEHPGRLAIASAGTVLTYQEVYERMLCINQKLQGVKKGEAVAVVTNKTWYQVVAILAILSRGCCYVPIDEAFPEKTIAHCLQTANAKVCLTDQANWHKVNGLPEVRAINVEAMSYAGSEGAEIVTTLPEDIVTIIFTSGTTGMPKGIRLKQMGVLNSICFTNERYHVTCRDRALALTNICHDMSMYDMFGMIAAGGTIVLPEKDGARNPQHWMQLMDKYQVTIFNSVPAFAEMLFTQERENVNKSVETMRLVIHGGDFFKPSLAKHWLKANSNLQLVNVGGPTETSLWSIYHDVTAEEIAAESIPYGKAIANMKHYILNDLREEVPAGVIGTIYSEGIGLAVEYVGQPEATAEKFITFQGRRLFQTGDLGYYSAEGEIMICGRNDNQVKINGKRIELEEIEKHMNHLETIEAACVVYQRENKQLVAYYTGVCLLEKDKIRAKLKQELPAYMIPPLYIHLDALPLTRNGKLDRNSLAEKNIDAYLMVKPKDEHYRDELEEDLYREAARLLGRTYIEKGANFFMEGGNSILAIRLLAYIKQKYSVSIGLGEVFCHPCMHDWHALVAEKQRKSESTQAVPASSLNRDHIPLSPAQTGIWFYENANSSAKYTVCTYMKMKGHLDEARLETVLREILADNEVFQLNYDMDERGIPYQFVNMRQGGACIEYMDIQEEDEIEPILQTTANHKFDLKKEPLCKFIIVRVNPKLHYLIAVVHHLIVDETTIEVLFSEIMERYQGIQKRAGDKKACGYLEYCLHKKSRCDQAYWREIFGSMELAELNFGEQDRTAELPKESGCIDFAITDDMLETLKLLCDRKGCTLFSALYSFYIAALYLHSGKNCIFTTATFSDRIMAAYANSYGMFVYNQCIAYHADIKDTLGTLMDTVNTQILKIYDMPLCSLNDIIRDLGLPSAYLKLQNHQVFTYVDNDRASFSLPDLEVEPVEIVKKVNDLDLNLLIEKVGGKLVGHLYYSHAYFSDEQAMQLLHLFEGIMMNGLPRLDEPLLNLAGEGPKEEVLELEENIF